MAIVNVHKAELICDKCGATQKATDQNGNALDEATRWAEVACTRFRINTEEYGGECHGHICPQCFPEFSKGFSGDLSEWGDVSELHA